MWSSLDRQAKAERGLPLNGHDVVLANPPFSGRLDRDRLVDDVKIGTSTATELLFVKYMIDTLKPDGRCGVTRRTSCSAHPARRGMHPVKRRPKPDPMRHKKLDARLNSCPETRGWMAYPGSE